MTHTNGTDKQTENVGPAQDPKTGKFLPGNKGGPGGLPRKIELVPLCRRMAKAEGLDLDKLLWGVVKGVMLKAGKGDGRCAKLLLERFCGALDKGPTVAVEVDARQVNTGTGPAVPSNEQLADYFGQLSTLSNGLRIEVVEPGAQDALQELLG